MAEDLAKFKLQYEQVEAALLGDPSNSELMELKANLEEMIQLQEEILENERKEAAAKDTVPQQPKLWKVGDRVIAPLPTGKGAVAVIDNFTAAGYAITFVGSKQKTIVDPSALVPAPDAPGMKKKSYNFGNKTMDREAKQAWLLEKEKKRLKLLKKEAQRKEIDSVAEAVKKDWVSFNKKAMKRGLEGLKKISATNWAKDTGARKNFLISSRANDIGFKSYRGNMSSVF